MRAKPVPTSLIYSTFPCRNHLAELDENLIRIDLSATDGALHIAQRKNFDEVLHPVTERGSPP